MAGGVQALGRGLVMRCPTCGAGDLFVSYYTMRERCLNCGTAFEREEGYWVGAMIVLIGATELLFALWFVGGMLLTWPDVPWTGLLIGGVVLNLTFPFFAYSWSKTAWMGLHDAFVPEEPTQQADAITALDARRRAAAIAFRDESAAARDQAVASGDAASGDAASGDAAPGDSASGDAAPGGVAPDDPNDADDPDHPPRPGTGGTP
jgi:uncharacterized protein (DUF983 family)